MVVRERRRRGEDFVEDEAEHADRRLGEGVPAEEIPDATRPPARDPRADGHSSHEDGQDERLRVRGVSQEQLQVMRPDGFVDESGESGSGKQCEEQRASPARRPRNVVRRSSVLATRNVPLNSRWIGAETSSRAAPIPTLPHRANVPDVPAGACRKLPLRLPRLRAVPAMVTVF